MMTIKRNNDLRFSFLLAIVRSIQKGSAFLSVMDSVKGGEYHVRDARLSIRVDVKQKPIIREGAYKVGSKKFILLVLTAGVTFLSMTGCGSSGNEPAAESTENVAVQQTKAPNPVELTIHLHMWDKIAFDDEWPVFKKAAELTNVKLKGTAPKSASKSPDVFNLMVASGDIPDIVHYELTGLQNLASDGGLVPLNDLINQHAPNIKKALDQRPDIKKQFTMPDGNIYYLPDIYDGTVAKGWMIRQDWLDKLALQVPTTLDEYVKVLRAFRDRDPNGNNKKDEIPYFSRNQLTGVYDLLVFWNASRSLVLQGDKVVFGPLEPQFKTAMSEIAQWYKEGLIDKEIFTRGDKARNILFGDDNGGSTHDWFTSTLNFNTTLQTKYPSFKLSAMAPPAGIDGKQREATRKAEFGNLAWAISKNSKYQAEAIRYFDFWFTEEGKRLANFGVEGVTYNMVDGKPQIKPDLLQGDFVGNLQKYGAQIEIGTLQDRDVEKQSMTPEAAAAVEMYNKNGYPEAPFPTLPYTEEQKKEMAQLKSSIDTYMNETLQKWVIGVEDVEARYDNFVKTLKDMKVDKYVQIAQTAYETSKK